MKINLADFFGGGGGVGARGSCPAKVLCNLNPLSPNSDKHLISPHNITDSSNMHVTRMNEMITKDGMS